MITARHSAVAVLFAIAMAAGVARVGAADATEARAIEAPASVPLQWRELTDLAASAENAATSVPGFAGSTMDLRARAWGDPGSGCFLVITEVQMPGDASESLSSLSAFLVPALAAEAFEVEQTAAGSATHARLRFASSALRGELRAAASAAGPQRIDLRVAACFYSRREPERCARHCQNFWPDIEGRS